MREADLNEESGNAAAYWLSKKMNGASEKDRQSSAQYVAEGFYMGYRKCEEHYRVEGIEWMKGKLSSFGKKLSELKKSLKTGEIR
jgi:hypothetical protein